MYYIYMIVYACMHACMHACMDGWMDVGRQVGRHVYVYMYICMSVSLSLSFSLFIAYKPDIFVIICVIIDLIYLNLNRFRFYFISTMQELPRQQAAIVHLSSMQLNAGPATHHLGEAPLGLDVPEISLQQHQV